MLFIKEMCLCPQLSCAGPNSFVAARTTAADGARPSASASEKSSGKLQLTRSNTLCIFLLC